MYITRWLEASAGLSELSLKLNGTGYICTCTLAWRLQANGKLAGKNLPLIVIATSNKFRSSIYFFAFENILIAYVHHIDVNNCSNQSRFKLIKWLMTIIEMKPSRCNSLIILREQSELYVDDVIQFLVCSPCTLCWYHWLHSHLVFLLLDLYTCLPNFP